MHRQSQTTDQHEYRLRRWNQLFKPFFFCRAFRGLTCQLRSLKPPKVPPPECHTLAVTFTRQCCHMLEVVVRISETRAVARKVSDASPADRPQLVHKVDTRSEI